MPNMRIPVLAHATDPLTLAGLVGQLRFQPELRLVPRTEICAQVVAVVAADVATTTLALLSDIRDQGCERAVLVVEAVDEAALLPAIESGVRGLVHRAEATGATLANAVANATRTGAALPADLVGLLLEEISRTRGECRGGLSPRESAVLKMAADGLDTAGIAQQLCYSSRTVKNILHAVVCRYQLRNRTHAVAYALREGLI
ncbi:helix-turn-helix transcriptional regulator [Actinophytocola oryzae]|uniref:DNA-binding NarL/FixJ family response regulator n=1 Tax=Actinophytocola oryzae TaxID=502181 RepID=A0A4R7W326_9PSEU|nr:response regulator transcription factor [Actinophytocola oryzae]TDV56289.1 DNA-binding NarL/FixJ family response regulator [Actinophytocola oryzae]